MVVSNGRLFFVSVLIVANLSMQAQVNEFTLSECAKAFYDHSSNLDSLESNTKALQQCMIGKKFPSFASTAISGKRYSTSDFEGKVVLVTTWFSSCNPCVAEMPLLNELNKKYKDKGFLILSFSPEKAPSLLTFMADHPLTYDVIANVEEMIVHRLQFTYGYPTNIFLNKKGEIVKFKMGGPTQAAGLDELKIEFTEIIESELAK